ncbi:hypothetical protein [Billgrantia bachuensis]|uniref:N-acetyltransferase domain-containing protein n=1 Tax=Billgrantia bachuensis TaxID=2717286 RepID=A0ABX0PM39_9GAMM|nr:hypothetical protein [Halomonas bachuensis]NIC03974.1 hypothetical protein [Halomonas bachuensis]
MTAEDRAILAPAMDRDAADIEADVAAGRARVLRFADGSRGVVRLEVTPTGQRELVLVACAGRGYREKVGKVVAAAKARGWRVRAHTSQNGIARWLEGLGFREVERVYLHE